MGLSRKHLIFDFNTNSEKFTRKVAFSRKNKNYSKIKRPKTFVRYISRKFRPLVLRQTAVD